jgi:hypothetical protein
VRFSARRFPPNVVPWGGQLTFSADDLAHALFVTGRAPADRFLYGMASIHEFLHRTSLIPAYIRRDYNGRLLRSRLSRELDRSEVVGLSYALGQAATAIFCRTMLSVDYLMHIDRYSLQHGVFTGATRKRADLFGLAPQGWVVAEAKGRSGSMEFGLTAKMEAQKRSVLAIGGSAPYLSVSCVASFPRQGEGMRVDAYDPDVAEPEAVQIPANLDDFMFAYYLPFVRALEHDGAEVSGSDDGVRLAGFTSNGLRIGLLAGIHEAVAAAEQASGSQEGLGRQIQSIVADQVDEEFDGFPDGTVVQTNWQEALGTRDWQL